MSTHHSYLYEFHLVHWMWSFARQNLYKHVSLQGNMVVKVLKISKRNNQPSQVNKNVDLFYIDGIVLHMIQIQHVWKWFRISCLYPPQLTECEALLGITSTITCYIIKEK